MQNRCFPSDPSTETASKRNHPGTHWKKAFDYWKRLRFTPTLHTGKKSDTGKTKTYESVL